jgi:competence CoiA-like predicted nuclease
MRGHGSNTALTLGSGRQLLRETTLVATRTDTNERLTIGDLSTDELRTLSDARLLRCLHCGGSLMLKAGSVRLHHFAHVTLSDCSTVDHETETD